MSPGPAPKARLVEVGPRDGLQNEKAPLPVEQKIAFVDRLSETGLLEIEVGAFVRPDRVPQMAGSEQVFRGIRRKPGVVYSALVPNERGLERALASRADKVAVFTAASETFSLKNADAGIQESLERLRPAVQGARRAGLPVRGYVSTAFHCPYEGPVAPEAAVEVCLRLRELGAEELSVGDTIGKADPDGVRKLLDLLLSRVPAASVFLHFHDTYGRAVENALCAFREYGITGFDASAGGLGGCPFAPGASGNVATEALLRALREAGAALPAEPEAVALAAAPMLALLGR